MKNFIVNGKVAVITGAAGGIGKAVAKELHSQGAIIIATDLSQSLLDDLVIELGAERVMGIALDVTSVDNLMQVREKVHSTFGHIDFIFANAGIACDPPTTIAKMNVNIFEKVIEVDLLGVTRTVKAFLPDILASHGHILVTSSIYAYCNGVLNAPYAAAKAGVEAYTRALRSELAGTGASAGVLYPGWVATPFSKSAFGGDELASQLRARFFKGPLGKAVSPESIANAVAKGIVKRKARIHAPKRWAPFSILRGLMCAISDYWLDKDTLAHRVIKKIEGRSIASNKERPLRKVNFNERRK